MKATIKLTLAMIMVSLLASCSKDDEPTPVELLANAGPDQTVAPFTVVTLDGSASTGPSDASISYQWILNSGQDINISNQNSVIATFEPKINGNYEFILRITSASKFSEDYVSIFVTGALELSGTLTANTTLLDVEPDPSKPDYVISSDLTIPNGVTLNFPSSSNSGIIVKAANNTGIIIQQGGTLSVNASTPPTFTADTGWKGILVDGGRIDFFSSLNIEKAGASAFSGQPEPAAITLAGTQPTIAQMSGVLFRNSASYDLLVTTAVSSNTPDNVVQGNAFSSAKPIKAQISFLSKISSNSYPANYDYIYLIPSGGNTIDAVTGTFAFTPNGRFFIDGDFLAGSNISAQSATIFMKEGAGILAQKDLQILSSTIKGIDGASWKGIAVASSSNTLAFSGSTIENAGSAVFQTGFFTSPVKASIYFNASHGTVTNSTIVNSGGYGVYNDAQNADVIIQNCTFNNSTQPAISVVVGRVNSTVGQNNTFNIGTSNPAVEVRVPSLLATPVSTWFPLGGSNYYLFTNNVRLSSGSWTLSPGVNLKFKAGKFLELEQGSLIATGTAASPITFDSEAGTPGTWAGIHVQTLHRFEFCHIKNGGELVILKNGVTPATEKANLVFNYGGSSSANVFKNNTISGGGGYGLLVEATKQNPDALNPANNNTFSNNSSGNVIIK